MTNPLDSPFAEISLARETSSLKLSPCLIKTSSPIANFEPVFLLIIDEEKSLKDRPRGSCLIFNDLTLSKQSPCFGPWISKVPLAGVLV